MNPNVLTLTNDPGKHKEYRCAARALRCSRCTGCLHFEPEPLDGSISLVCLSCGRSEAWCTVDDLIDTFGLDPRDAQLAARRPISFVWRRP